MLHSILEDPIGIESSSSAHANAAKNQNLWEYQWGGKLDNLELLIPRDNIITRFHLDKKLETSWSNKANCKNVALTHGLNQHTTRNATNSLRQGEQASGLLVQKKRTLNQLVNIPTYSRRTYTPDVPPSNSKRTIRSKALLFYPATKRLLKYLRPTTWTRSARSVGSGYSGFQAPLG